jgi:hypothetical protein
MVLRLKTRESRSLPGLLKARKFQTTSSRRTAGSAETTGRPQAAFLLRYNKPEIEIKGLGNAFLSPSQETNSFGICSGSKCNGFAVTRSRHSVKPNALGAGWSSPVARQAHNLKAAGSNPAPATKSTANSATRDICSKAPPHKRRGAFCVSAPCRVHRRAVSR